MINQCRVLFRPENPYGKIILNIILCYVLSTVFKCWHEPSNIMNCKGEVSFTYSLTSQFSTSHKYGSQIAIVTALHQCFLNKHQKIAPGVCLSAVWMYLCAAVPWAATVFSVCHKHIFPLHCCKYPWMKPGTGYNQEKIEEELLGTFKKQNNEQNKTKQPHYYKARDLPFTHPLC